MKLLDRTGYREHLSAEARDKGEDRLANLDELITAAHEFDDEQSRQRRPGIPGRDHAGFGRSTAGTRTPAPSR